jgi:predicted XRE-type DNA-binding protein
MDSLVIHSEIGSRIITLRGEQMLLDRDIAELYGVETKRLNEQARRNIERFPEDFMFQLTKNEKNELVAKCDRFELLKHSTTMPYAFTEQGIYMLASVLKSPQAIAVNIAIIRTFKKLREFTHHYNSLAKKLMEADHKHDKRYRELKQAMDDLIATSQTDAIRQIGFIHEKNI